MVIQECLRSSWKYAEMQFYRDALDTMTTRRATRWKKTQNNDENKVNNVR